MKNLFAIRYSLFARKGLTALPMLLIMSGIIVEIAIGFSLIAFLFSSGNVGARLAQEALAASHAGIQDALLRIARNKNWSSGGYSIGMGNNSVTVIVEKDIPASGQDRITSTGTARIFSKKVQAVYNVNATTGEMALVSYEVVSF